MQSRCPARPPQNSANRLLIAKWGGRCDTGTVMYEGPTTVGSKRGAVASPIRHVLFDADGVLQDMPGGWEAGAEPYFGERTMEFLYRLYDEELPTLTGQGNLLPLVAAALADFGVTAPLEEVYAAIWL